MVSECHLQDRSSGTADRKSFGGSVLYISEKKASRKSVDQFGVKGYGDILTVLILIHISGMKCIGISKDCLSLFQVKGILIDLVEHFALFDISKLDLRMPVPQKGTGLIAGKPLVAYQEWEGAVSVFFSSFPAGSVMICKVLPPSFCARILKCISAFHSGIYFIRKGRKCKGYSGITTK